MGKERPSLSDRIQMTIISIVFAGVGGGLGAYLMDHYRLNPNQRCFDNNVKQEYFLRQYPLEEERNKQVERFCNSDCYLNKLDKALELNLNFPEAHELAKNNCNL